MAGTLRAFSSSEDVSTSEDEEGDDDGPDNQQQQQQDERIADSGDVLRKSPSRGVVGEEGDQETGEFFDAFFHSADAMDLGPAHKAHSYAHTASPRVPEPHPQRAERRKAARRPVLAGLDAEAELLGTQVGWGKGKGKAEHARTRSRAMFQLDSDAANNKKRAQQEELASKRLGRLFYGKPLGTNTRVSMVYYPQLEPVNRELAFNYVLNGDSASAVCRTNALGSILLIEFQSF